MYIIPAFIFSLALLNLSFAQDTALAPKTMTVKLDLVYPAIGLVSPQFQEMLHLSVESPVKKNQSVQISGMYSTFKNNETYQYSLFGTNFSFNAITVQKTWQMMPQYRFYYPGKNFYLGPYVKYAYTHSKSEIIPNDTVARAQNGVVSLAWHAAGLGGMAGYQFFIFNNVSVDLSLGLGVRKNFYNKIISGTGLVKSSLADGLFSLNIGYRFRYKNRIIA